MPKDPTKPNRLGGWNDSLMNKLPAISRKRRKRQASKRRRRILRQGSDWESANAY
jgi:hypothetical protein